MRMSDSTQLFIKEFMLPKIKLEPAEKKIKLEFEDKKKAKNNFGTGFSQNIIV